MESAFSINIVDTSAEIMARILQSISRKYECNLKIRYQEGQLVTEFVGDPAYKRWIAREADHIIRRR